MKRLICYLPKLFLKFYFKKKISDKKFSVISNDCWGAEIYKLLNRPFNTPFIGLMLMSPCYIKLLENPRYYLALPLTFKDESKYPSIQEIHDLKYFPIGTLGDTGIEIQFLHFSSSEIAAKKWERRVKRIDWDNLFIKYDCGKDYATKEHVQKLITMNYTHLLIFGNNDYGLKKVICTKKYSKNGVEQFKNCFLNFNPILWIDGNENQKDLFNLLVRKIAYKCL